MGAPTPLVLIKAFASDADDPDFRRTIPTTTATLGRASLNEGFPSETMQPVVAGGKPPFGQDANGILYMVSLHTVKVEAGEHYLYNGTLSAEISGYALGAVLGMADGSGAWLNTTDGNTVDPEGAGTGWVSLYSYGETVISGLTGGTVTLTPTQAKRKLIVLQGVLVSNLTIVVPNTFEEWRFVNLTTGAFTTTVKVTGQTGTVVPQGDYTTPKDLYGNGTDVFPTFTPAALPIDPNPTANTIVQRTNTGLVNATGLNQSTVAAAAFAVANVFADSGDGTTKRISLADFIAQLNPAQLPTSPGYIVFPAADGNPVGGIKLQWGTSGSVPSGGGVTVFFPLAFSAAVFHVGFTAQNGGGVAQATDFVAGVTLASFTQRNSGSVPRTYTWFAIGL